VYHFYDSDYLFESGMIYWYKIFVTNSDLNEDKKYSGQEMYKKLQW